MELAVGVSKRKLASIDLVGLTEVPLQPVLGKQIGAAIQKVFDVNLDNFRTANVTVY